MNLFSKSETPRTTLLAIVESEAATDAVQQASAQFPTLETRVKPTGDSLADAARLVNGSADVVLVEVDMRDDRALPTLRKLAGYVGVSGHLIVLARGADARAVREAFRLGASDVLDMPASPSEVSQSIASALKTPRTGSGRALGRVISVLKCGGGAGATMVAVNLGQNIAARRKVVSGNAPRVLVIDLDPQFGSVASVCGLTGRVSVLDLVRKGADFDGSHLETTVQEVAPNLDILASSSEIVPLSAISPDFLQLLLAAARERYDYILLDHSMNWSASTAMALRLSDVILAVALPSVEHAKAAMTILGGLDDIDVAREKAVFVHNRVKGLSHRDRIQNMDSVTRRPSVQIPEDDKAHSNARNHGKLLSDVGGSKGQIKAITKLADKVFEMMNTPIMGDALPPPSGAGLAQEQAGAG